MVKLNRRFRGVSRVFGLMAAFVLTILALSTAMPQAAAARTWTITGSLVTGRYGHTATLLPNGRVLVAGGSGALASAELFDPATGTWSETGVLHNGRSNHTATLLPNGRVLVAGGSGALASAELFDPATGTWSETGALHTGRFNHTATLLPNGKVLVAGGYNDTDGPLYSAEIYDPDPAAGTWTVNTGFLNNKGRYWHTASLLSTGKVLVAGGYNGGPLKLAELYDPATDIWIVKEPLTTARAEHTATLLPNGRVLVAGGYDADNTVFLSSAEVYDPATGWTTTGPLSNSRSQHTATLLPNGRVLVAGGLNAISPMWLTSAETYDPAKGAWSATGSLTFKRGSHTATLLPNGRVLVAGGIDNGNPLRSAELYNRPDISAAIDLLLFD